ncbi:hypothetical protein LCGC14_2780120 [marine sediment metagenome]|uniref:Major capsid protein n=1 Tax=marine sediment metagenome TaxID=412755 RepID=A0A0F8YTI0_9ZZZZ
MALSGGHWDTLAEVLKLTLPTLIPGTVDEDVKRGNPVDILPFAQANHTGELIRWLRESTTAEADVANIGIGGQTSFTEGVTYDVKEATLRIKYIMRKLDKYVPSIHGTMNDYEEILAKEIMRGSVKNLGNSIIYDDFTYDGSSLQMDGLHATAALNAGEVWDIDMGEAALSLEQMRILSDELKHGFDFWLMSFALARKIDAAYMEKGLVGLKADTAGTMGLIEFGKNEAGGRMTFFDGKPIIRSDFMVAEQANTGVGSDARAKYSSGTKQYSIFAILRGQASLAEEDPGLKVAFGNTETEGGFFNLEMFDKLENYIGKAMRMASYTELVPGSKYCVGRIFDITNVAVLV